MPQIVNKQFQNPNKTKDQQNSCTILNSSFIGGNKILERLGGARFLQ